MIRNRILVGDSIEQMRTLPDGCAHCCITSPPYWGLRDYGTAQWEGGKSGCGHKKKAQPRSERPNKTGCGIGEGGPSQEARDEGALAYRDRCGKCGAVRIDDQLGLEKTPEEYVARMVGVFREVKRVLRDDGTLWLNLGDSFASNASKGGSGAPNGRNGRGENYARPGLGGLKPKDLAGIPWRVAFALQADGWYLRSEIIWSKPNPMPESVTDRPTKAHEQIFLLAKSPTYYYDHESIKEKCETPVDSESRGGSGPKDDKCSTAEYCHSNEPGKRWAKVETRNKRSVWNVATRPYGEAHFATFPPDLIRPCVRAGCPAGGVVLDPFMGAGTTALVAAQENRGFLGCELNAEYAEMARRRVDTEVRQGKMF